MTVIATDGRTIAADGLVTFGYERGMRAETKIRICGNRLYAFAGSTAFFTEAVEWHQFVGSWKDVPKSGSESWSMLVIYATGAIETIHSDNGLPVQVRAPFADRKSVV